MGAAAKGLGDRLTNNGTERFPTGRRLPFVPWNRGQRAVAIALAVGVGALMILSPLSVISVFAGSTTSNTSSGLGAGAGGNAALRDVAASGPTSSPGLRPSQVNIGQDPQSEPLVTSQTLAATPSLFPHPTGLQLNIWNNVTNASGQPGWGVLQAPSAHPGSGTQASSVRAATTNLQTATAWGYVKTLVNGAVTAVPGAAVQAYPVGLSCPTTTCAPGTTTQNGYFKIVVLVPADQIQVTAGGYLDNYTLLTNISAGSNYDVGTIFLVPDASICGYVEGADPGHEPVADIEAVGQSRDGRIIASPSAYTNSAGHFCTFVPPGPSEVTFTPVQGNGLYFPSNVYVDLQPGQVDSTNWGIGGGNVMYLQLGVKVTATLYSSTTGKEIYNWLGSFFAFAAIRACERDNTGVCFNEGSVTVLPGSPGPVSPIAIAPAAPDLITFYATGYISNTTYITVPELAPGHTYNMGRINLIQNGIVELTPTLTYAKAAANAIAKWGTGLVYETVCSLDGFKFSQVTQNTFGGYNMTNSECQGGQGCGNLNNTVEMIAAPLRNSINILPDDTGTCHPPIPTWPIPGDLPVTGNWSYINATPDRILNIGSVGLTPGTYVLGNVAPSTALWSASDCSTDELSWCGATAPGNTYYLQNNITIYYQHVDEDPAGCPATYYYFCVPVVPGPSLISITGLTSTSNSTVAYVPPGVWSQLPLPLDLASPRHATSINLTGAEITGTVLDALTGEPLPGAVTVSLSAAGLNTEPSGGTVADAAGAYAITALPGWVLVHAASPNFLVNFTWVYVGSGIVHARTIYLTPESYLEGRVVGPNGYSLNTSSAQVCPISNKGVGCLPIIGSGLTSTNGSYFALLPAAHLPIGGYMVVANAPGYLSNSTWVNVTEPGQTYTATTIVLRPILGSAGLPASRPHATNGSAAYVYGFIVDNSTGLGVPSATISLDPVGGGTPVTVASSISDIGQFNFTLGVGAYSFNVTYTGVYYPWSGFLTVNGSAPYINESTIRLVPLGYLRGRIVVDPWRNVVTISEGIGVQTLVTVASHNHEITSLGETDSGGFFNISAVNSKADLVFSVPSGGGQGSARQGFLENDTVWNTTKNGSLPFLVMGNVIYTAFTGVVRDGSTNNATPVRFGSIALTVATPNFAVFTYTEALGGGGEYTIFMPPGNITNGLTPASQVSAYMPHNFSYRFPLAWFANNLSLLENISASAVWLLPKISLAHFGWLNFQVDASVAAFGGTSSVVPYAVATATVITKNDSVVSGASAVADGHGFVNMTAPIGRNLTLTVAAPDFNGTVVENISVNESATTFVNGSSAQIGSILLQPWGWVWGTVVDSALGVPVYGASATVSNPNGSGTVGIISNGAGFFMSDAPPGAVDQVSVTLNGYLTNNTRVKVGVGELGNLTPLNLTGLGVVAGRIFVYPGNVPLYGATVSVCPIASPTCQNSNVTTNGTGYFWVVADPGRDTIAISAPGYSENTTPGTILVRSDVWEWAGNFVIDQYATVTGTLLGDPSGLPVVGANVSMCSAIALPGQPTGPCFVTVLTDSIGQFELSVPYGNYILALNATGYNATYLSLSLGPGEYASIGTIFLEALGTVQGTVFGQDTNAPVVGALVQACERWSVGNCTGNVPVSASGAFSLSGPPGPYVLVVAGPNYQDAYVHVVLLAGIVTTIFTIFLIPTGTNLLYSVQGSVVGGENSTPLDGAVVTAGSNFATATNASGGFVLSIPWGVYVLTAEQNGYSAESRTITVHADLSGIEFALPQTVYTVSGLISDGLTGAPISQARIVVGGTQLASSGPTGSYSVALPNGTYTITVSPPVTASNAGGYGTVNISVGISGAAVTRNILLYPGSTEISGLVVDSLTGAPIANASVVISGATEDGLPVSEGTLFTTAQGTFSARVYFGTYRINVSAAGYLPNFSPVVAKSSAILPATLALTPVSATATSGSGGFTLGSALLLAGIAAIGVVAYLGLGPWRTESGWSPPATNPSPQRLDGNKSTVQGGSP